MTLRRLASLLTVFVVLALFIGVSVVGVIHWPAPAVPMKKPERQVPRPKVPPPEIELPFIRHISADTIAKFKTVFDRKAHYGVWARHAQDHDRIHFFADWQTSVKEFKEGIPGFEMFVAPAVDLPEVAEDFGITSLSMTDDGLRHVCRSKNLIMLILDWSKVTDDGLKDLEHLKKLSILSLRDTQISDAGIEHIARVSTLKVLYLNNTKISDVGVRRLLSLKNLKCVGLGGTAITDAGVKDLVQIKSLVSVHLAKTRLTDITLSELTGIPNLEFVSLFDAKTTKEGREVFRKAMPGCLIYPEW